MCFMHLIYVVQSYEENEVSCLIRHGKLSKHLDFLLIQLKFLFIMILKL